MIESPTGGKLIALKWLVGLDIFVDFVSLFIFP